MSDNLTLTIQSIIEKAQSADSIKILGCNPLVETLTSTEFIIALRQRIEALYSEKKVSRKFPFFVLYMESEQEDFYQQLTDIHGKANYKMRYIDKKVKLFGEKQANYKSALVTDISNRIKRRARDENQVIDELLLEYVEENIVVRQFNLRMPYNAISFINDSNEEIWYCPLSLNVSKIQDYIFLDKSANDGFGRINHEVSNLFKYLEISDSNAEKMNFKPEMGGKKFTSAPDSELIEAYDEITNKRVAIFDRDAFLTLEYKRASIWGFIFNRKGQLMLHRRSNTTADNRNMWDKSTGGHVDLTDASTVETAKREFIEEVYMKDSEFSNYNNSKIEMVVDFGEWRRALRADASFVEAFIPFTGKDKHVIMFRAFVEEDKKALTVDRDSVRKITDKNNPKNVTDKFTRFRSDVFFFITAENEMDNDEQMKNTLKIIENKDADSKGAASDHKLVAIDDLRQEVMNSEAKGEKVFTDDMVHIVKNYWGYLTEFSSFVKDTFERIDGLKGK
jgi:hypothetical protein